jgi:hypothetical protein
MKINSSKISSIVVLFLFLNHFSFGQEKKFAITASGIITQYIKIEEGKFTSVPGYYNFPVTPGAEILFTGQLFGSVSVATGINFQQGNVSSYLNENQKRFHFTEVSFPVLLKKSFQLDNQKSLYFSSGVYFGKMTSVKDDYYTSFGWEESSEIQNVAHYSDDISFSDIYFDAGYLKPLNSKFELSFSPFLKYRLNSTWLNHHHKRVHYGIKVNVSFKI